MSLQLIVFYSIPQFKPFSIWPRLLTVLHKSQSTPVFFFFSHYHLNIILDQITHVNKKKQQKHLRFPIPQRIKPKSLTKALPCFSLTP